MAVLLIEDDEDIRMVFEQIFKLKGIAAFCASNGREGIELLKKHGDRIRLIFLDLMMPVMNGWEFLDEMQGLKGTEHIPTIVVSGAASLESVASRVTACLKKPVDIHKLFELVDRYCRGPLPTV